MVKDFPDIGVTRADGRYGKILHYPSLPKILPKI